MGDLGNCLHWKTLIQYRFKKVNHINVNEDLSYRSLLKHLAKTVQGSSFGVLLDSRVTIGCNAKGRSSSATLNYYLSTSLPYVLGGGLYPYLFHVGTDDNCADDPSRLVPLRCSLTATPFWLKTFQSGNLTKIVASRRESLRKDFVSWGSSELQCNFQQVTGSGLLLGTALVAYGKALFYGGSPKYTSLKP